MRERLKRQKGECGRAAEKGKEGTATSAEPGTSVSGTHIGISTLEMCFRYVSKNVLLGSFLKVSI